MVNDSNLQHLARKDSDKIATAALQQKPTPISNHKRYMLVLRCSVVGCIMLVAACIGYFAFYVVQSSESRQSKDAYKDLIRQLLPAANTGLQFSLSAQASYAKIIIPFHLKAFGNLPPESITRLECSQPSTPMHPCGQTSRPLASRSWPELGGTKHNFVIKLS